MAEKKGTLDDRRKTILALWKGRNNPEPEPEVKAEHVSKLEQVSEEEEAERKYVKQKARYKKKQQGKFRPRR